MDQIQEFQSAVDKISDALQVIKEQLAKALNKRQVYPGELWGLKYSLMVYMTVPHASGVGLALIHVLGGYIAPGNYWMDGKMLTEYDESQFTRIGFAKDLLGLKPSPETQTTQG